MFCMDTIDVLYGYNRCFNPTYFQSCFLYLITLIVTVRRVFKSDNYSGVLNCIGVERRREEIPFFQNFITL